MLRNLGRAIGVVRTLAKYDATFVVDRLGLRGLPRLAFTLAAGGPGAEGRGLPPGQRLAAAVQEMGPSFVKFGQALSTRPDVVGEQLAADLGALRDRMAPFPSAEARRTIAEQLGEEDPFATFADEPAAAASIAQVHYATLADGRKVAVKVLRPDIEVRFARDIDLFRWISERVEAARPDLRRLEPRRVVQMFRSTVDAEMDLRLEAAAASELAENFADDPTFRVPDIDWRHTQRRVLTSSRAQGIPITDRDGLLAAGRDPETIVRNLLTAFLKQAFRDGFFHADLHHGNLFVDEHNNLIAVDFGIMGRLDRPQRRYVAEMLLAFLTGDYRRAAEVHFEAGYVRSDQSVDAFAQACRSIAKPVFERPLNEVSVANLLAQLFRITESFDMRTQPQLLLLQKTMVVVEGLCRGLAPDADLWGVARAFLQEWAPAHIGPAAQAQDAVEELAAAARRIPGLVEKAELAAGAFTAEGLRVHAPVPEGFPGDSAARREGSRDIPINTILFGVIGLLVLVLVVQFVT